jgi:hypothetical protein
MKVKQVGYRLHVFKGHFNAYFVPLHPSSALKHPESVAPGCFILAPGMVARPNQKRP